MPEQTTETFVSIDELKWQLIRLRTVNSETIRMSSSHIAFFQAIERHLDCVKALLSSVEDLILEKLRMDLFNDDSLYEFISLFRLFRSESLRNHRDRLCLIRTIVAMDRTELNMLSIYDTYQRAHTMSYKSTHFYLELMQSSFGFQFRDSQ
ncbi:hypothetical protein QR98_0042020 [Sarcoptes scabiei]|uniref:Uncharacterized protein n=1 Tax=Sarcoptes scabiei TaxID=52283 RepID=A0A132A454_SARSC|nr:hypothetical protein QR98_0042020 [Sarcoptes scabiei]